MDFRIGRCCFSGQQARRPVDSREWSGPYNGQVKLGPAYQQCKPQGQHEPLKFFRLVDSGATIRSCRNTRTGWRAGIANYKPHDWNELKAGFAHCTCNGEVLEAGFKLPATGPIGLEGDRGQMEYRRIRIQEQP
jgi:hypothetical protein